jgi:hypothetical protein
MRLIIFHGRDDPNQELDDWGYDGPTIYDVVALHGTYGNLNVFFASDAAAAKANEQTGWDRFCSRALRMKFHEELLVLSESDGCVRYYGDWEFQVVSNELRDDKWPNANSVEGI